MNFEHTQWTLTQDSLPSVKKYLKTGWPDAKSSHRLEAFARACGFRTYASIRARIADHNSVQVAFSRSSIDMHLKRLSGEGQPHA